MKFRRRLAKLVFFCAFPMTNGVLVCTAVAGDRAYRVIYEFGHAYSDGWAPVGVPAVAKNGDLYGVTSGGGISIYGTVFKLAVPRTRGGAWTKTVLYDFPGGQGGGSPLLVIIGPDGSLYGVASSNTIFELKAPGLYRTAAWKYVPLYTLNGNSDGMGIVGLIFGTGGNLYGVTEVGGEPGCEQEGCGTVFELKRPTQKGGRWHFRVLYTFSGKPDGAEPFSGVTFDKNGNLYGTTWVGGANDWGAVFRLKPPTKKGQGWKETVLYSFDLNNNDIISPEGPVTVGSSGNLYGTTPLGGDLNCAGGLGCGVVYKLSPTTQKGRDWTYATLYAFTGGNDGANGGFAGNALVFDDKGSLYGTTPSGYTLDGTLFRLTPPVNGVATPWTENTLHGFTGKNGDGAVPNGLTWGKWGHLYGVTMFGGMGCQDLGCGTAFELSP
jgi:uncharacterized repeat protein (TIGR03803 family)